MSSELIDEHEQGERVRQWLRDNGTAIIGGVGVGLTLIFGWQWWQRAQLERQLDAATQYEALANGAEQGADVAPIADTLIKDHGKTVYGALAALQQAGRAMSEGRIDPAADALGTALVLAKGTALEPVVGLRLARVELQQGKAEAALQRATALKDNAVAALAAEVRGDALVRLGRADDARAAYGEALTLSDVSAPTRRALESKLADLGGAPAGEA